MFGSEFESAPKQELKYEIIGSSNVTTSTDESGKVRKVFTNVNGLKTSEVGYLSDYPTGSFPDSEVVTSYTYDNLRRLTSVTSPEGIITSYEYDELVFMKKRTTPDDGENRYYYDKYGNLRFYVHNSETNPKVVYTGYDNLKRIKYKGVIPVNQSGATVTTFDPDNSLSIETSLNGSPDTSKLLVVNMYEKWVSEGVLGVFTPCGNPMNLTNIPAEHKNYKGRLVATAYRDKNGDGWNFKIYFYDPLGRVSYMLNKFCSVSTAKWIVNEYDNFSNITKQSVLYGGSSSSNQNIYYWYDYDDEGRLKEVRSSMHNAKTTARLDASYTYNKAGQIDSVYYRGVNNTQLKQSNQYDTRGRLTTIDTEKFDQVLTYYSNGNILSNTIYRTSPYWAPVYQNYEYDGLNRLTDVYDNGANSVENYQYTKDGNFIRKGRMEKSFVYDYVPGTNKISNVEWLENDESMGQNYINYDTHGNMTYNDLRNINAISYDDRNLPLSIIMGNVTANYRYDDQGNRIYKEQNGQKEYYLRDQSGKELAIFKVYTNTDTLKTINLYGNGILGGLDVNWKPTRFRDEERVTYYWLSIRSDERVYYIKDHLGSIRAAVDSAGNVIFAEDTYPFGEVSQSYTLGGYGNQKYDFTGKERDVESGLHYFGARFYDSDLGRWTSVDPLADKYPGWSPYNYCKDNPLRFFDPNGMELKKVKHGRQVAIVDQSIVGNVEGMLWSFSNAGLPISINNTFRTTEEQTILYNNRKKNKNPVAIPKTSRHESGFALDFNGVRSLTPEQEEMYYSIAAKYGFYPIKNDPPHLQANFKLGGYSTFSEAIEVNQNDWLENDGKIEEMIYDEKEPRPAIIIIAEGEKYQVYTKSHNSPIFQKKWNETFNHPDYPEIYEK